MERALMALSAIALVVGIILVSDVVVGAAIVFALWSRIAQANRQHQEMQIQMHKGGKLD
jgi:preprotein translocase subunit YajC